MEHERSQSLESQLREWSVRAGVSEYAVSLAAALSPVETLPGGVMERTLITTCLVSYLAPAVAVAEEAVAPGGEIDLVNEPPLPIAPSATAPTVEVTMIQGGRACKAHAMAGIFGVPEGRRLHTDDGMPAPKPVFSPDFLVSTLSDYFGNT